MIRRLLLAAVLVFARNAHAAATFAAARSFDGAPHREFATSVRASAITVADFNGDGISDVAVTSQILREVNVMFGRGDGTLGPAQAYAIGPLGASSAAGDFDGDGHLDLAVSRLGNGKIDLLHNRGDGTFDPVQTFDGGILPLSANVADFNGDGRDDLIVANGDGGTVAVLFGMKNRTFSPPLLSATADGTISVAVGDFNGDGKPDAVAANFRGNTVSILINRGDGLLVKFLDIASPDASTVMTGDWNRDGKTDILVFGDGLQGMLLTGKGDGSFNIGTIAIPGFYLVPPDSFDVDGDGNLDLVIATTLENTDVVSVLRGHGDGTFTDTGARYPWTGFFSHGKFDNDARPDLVQMSYFSGQVSVARNAGAGRFAGAPTLTLPPPTIPTDTPTPRSVAAGDFNGDGFSDVAVSNGIEATLTLFFGQANGSVGQKTFELPSPVWHLTAVDINGDGRTDLIYALNDDVRVAISNGDGTFTTGPSYPASQPGVVSVADFNGDGKLDLIYVNGGEGSTAVDVILGHGDGTFGGPIVAVAHNFSIAYRAALPGDFDRDGKTDFVVVGTRSSGSEDTEFVKGFGDGSFAAPLLSYSQDALGGLTGDFDGDGKLDLALILTAPLIAVRLGNGDGTFRPAVNYDCGFDPAAIVASDFDSDGRVDLAVSASSSDVVSILRGRSDGTFGAASISTYGTGRQPSFLAVGDFNGDLRPDLATVNSFSTTLSLLLNTSESRRRAAPSR